MNKLSNVNSLVNVQMAIDLNGFKTWIDGFLSPLVNICLWAVPTVTIIYISIMGFKWFGKKSEDDQVKPFWATVKDGVVVAVIVEAAAMILKIFGVN